MANETELVLRMLEEQKDLWKDCSKDITLITAQQFEIFGHLKDIRDELRELRKGRAGELENVKNDAVEMAVDKSKLWVLTGMAAAAFAIFLAVWK